ncbi:MAG: bifunctional metallophosphatase/5'-nucleotidase [Pseudanabaenaceae cyanobacterium]
MRRISIFLVALLATLLATQLVWSQGRTVTVKLIGINDFHGHLETDNLAFTMPNGQRVPAGGAEYLATHIARLKQKNPNTLIVSVGDTIGAAPLLSSLFHDEPAIEGLNLMGVELNGVGNHEFDRGWQELMRLQKGGCHPQTGCQGKDRYVGAKFQYLAANVIDRATGKPILPAYQIRRIGGVKIGLIGLTLEGTPNIVPASGVMGLEFRNEVQTINALVPELTRQGVRAIVVLLHEGGVTKGGMNECTDLSGPVVDIVKNTDQEVDLFLTGHTHRAYNCVVDGRVVTSASAFGRVVTDLDLNIDSASGQVRSIRARNLLVTRDVPPDPRLTELIKKYKVIADPLTNRVIGQISSDILRQPNSAGEMPLGNLIADAQLLATQAPDKGGAVVALMNPGGIRADLTYKPGGNVTFGDAFAVQPFGNTLVTMTLTGAEIKQLLESQFDSTVPNQNRILQVSSSLSYRWRADAPEGQKVSQITINGQPLRPEQEYRVTVNSFIADGGDNFAVLKQGRNRTVGIKDLEALEAYFRAKSPIPSPPLNRIQKE